MGVRVPPGVPVLGGPIAICQGPTQAKFPKLQWRPGCMRLPDQSNLILSLEPSYRSSSLSYNSAKTKGVRVFQGIEQATEKTLGSPSVVHLIRSIKTGKIVAREPVSSLKSLIRVATSVLKAVSTDVATLDSPWDRKR